MDAKRSSSLINSSYIVVNIALLLFILGTVAQLYGVFIYYSHIQPESLENGFIVKIISRFVISLAGTVVMVLILFFLRGLLKNFKLDIFFNAANVNKIKAVGYITILGSLLVSILRFCWVIMEFAKSDSLALLLQLNAYVEWKGILFGYIVLVIAESFKQGNKLQTDAELTI